MKLTKWKRKMLLRSLNHELQRIREHRPQERAYQLRRISRMIANLNGVRWPE